MSVAAPLQHAATPSGGGFLTPLRYPGGKGRLGPWLAELIRHNGLTGCWYIEPYAGGAGAALYLLMHGLVEHIVINDADPVIYAFWRSVVDHTDELIRLVERTPVSMAVRAEQLAVLTSPDEYSVVETGFAAFFLNRTSRSGILQGGVIGGKAQTGTYKLDARFNKDALISRIAMIGSLADRITVQGLDAMELLADVTPGLPEHTLVYLDPPYYVKGSQLYANHYRPEDHASIAEFVAQAPYPIVVTYDDCPEVRALYEGTLCTNFALHYSTHLSRPKASEVLFYRNLDLSRAPTMTRSFYLPDSSDSGQQWANG